MPARPPLYLFALDSADLDLVRAWTEAGFLPNMQRVMATGQVMTIDQPGGAFDEIGSWLSAFCGVSQYEHEYYASRRLKAGSYELQISQFEDSGLTPFWAVDGAVRLSSAILDLPEPFMTEGLNGIQLVGLNAHQETYAYQPPRSQPAELARSIIDDMGNFTVLPYDNYKKPPGFFLDQKKRALEMTRSRCAALRQRLAGESFDVVAIGFNELHDLGHALWPFDEHTGTEASTDPALKHGLRDVYVAVDEEIGRFLECIPQNANLMLVSTYGLKAQYPTADLGEALLDRLGYRVKKNQMDQGFGAISLARKIIPQPVRHMLSHYLPGAFQQELIRSHFSQSYDYGRSRIYAIPSIYSNWIRVNLAGRDPEGLVPRENYDSLLDEVEAAFRQMTDPDTGESVISTVLRPNTSPRADLWTSAAPDLVVHWKSSDKFLREVDHPSGKIRQATPHFLRNTYHRFPGFVLWQGPDANPEFRGSCSIVDLAPTCLDLLGVDIPQSLAGRSFRI